MQFTFYSQIAKITHCADEAAFVHRIWYMTSNNEKNGRNYRCGKYWTYDSAQALLKIFDFWTPKQLRRVIKNCVGLGLVETGNFSENPLDRRTWYTLTDKAREIYANGQMRLPEQENRDTQTAKSTNPNGQMFNNDTKKDTKKDTMEENPRDTRGTPEPYILCGEFENVLLTDDEITYLFKEWGKSNVVQVVEELSAYIASCGKRYKNHYATVSNWLLRRKEKEKRARSQQRY